MNALSLIEQARALGASFRIAEGGAVKVKSPAPLPDQLLAALRQHKAEIKQFLQTTPCRRLGGAVLDYQKELRLRHHDLKSEFYKDDPWVLGQITILKHHIAEVERYLQHGGALDLPRCCHQRELICLAAMRGFEVCILTPTACGYSLTMAKIT